MLKKNRWIACLCVCGLLCGVLSACGDVKPTVSEPNSAPTTTSSTTMSTTSTETTTTTTTTTTSATTVNDNQFYYRFMGERVLMTFADAVSRSSFYPIKQSESDWIVVGENQSFCFVENIGTDELLVHRYSGKLSDGSTLYCYVNPDTRKICMISLSMPSHYQYGENDKAAMETRVKKWMDAMGYHYSADNINVMMQGDSAKHLGYFAYVFVYNEIDGGVWLYVRKSTQGWRIVEMYLSIDNTLNNPEWIA